MKSFKFTPLLLAFMLVACGSSPSSGQPKTEWNETELALMKEHVYGIEVPYMYIEDNDQLYYEAELDMLLLMGAEIESNELELYKNLFIEDEWSLYTHPSFEGYCTFTKTIEHEGITKYVTADLYALKETYDEEQDLYIYDFSTEGAFHLNIYDHHHYEWPTEKFQALIQSTYDTDVIIPAYEDASRYIISSRTEESNIPSILAYTNAANPVADYENILVNAGWVMGGEDVKVAVHSTELIAIVFNFDQEAGILTIAVVEPTPSKPSIPLDEELVQLVEQINANFETAGYDFRIEWNDYYGHYDLSANLGPSTDESEANLKAGAKKLIDLIPKTGLVVGYDKYNDPANGGADILSNGKITYGYSLQNEEETFAIQIITYIYEGSLMAELTAYPTVY